MGEEPNCKDCIRVENAINVARGNTYSIKENTKYIREVEDRVVEVEKSTGIDNSRIDSLFETLNDIKHSLKDLSITLKKLELRPLEKYDKVMVATFSIIIGGIVGAVISKLF